MRDLQYTHDKSNTTLHTWSPVHSQQQNYTSHMVSSTLTTAELHFTHGLQYTHNSRTTLHTWSPVHSQQQNYTSHMVSSTRTTRAALPFTHDTHSTCTTSVVQLVPAALPLAHRTQCCSPIATVHSSATERHVLPKRVSFHIVSNSSLLMAWPV